MIHNALQWTIVMGITSKQSDFNSWSETNRLLAMNHQIHDKLLANAYWSQKQTEICNNEHMMDIFQY